MVLGRRQASAHGCTRCLCTLGSQMVYATLPMQSLALFFGTWTRGAARHEQDSRLPLLVSMKSPRDPEEKAASVAAALSVISWQKIKLLLIRLTRLDL